METARTILEQLGGNRFIAMTGARNFVGQADGLTFKIGRGAINKATHVRVRLDASDTYTVDFLAIRGVQVRPISTEYGVYADQLRARFTAATGMDTSL